MRILGTPAKHTKQSFHDAEAISRLQAILTSHELVKPDLKFDDKWPNIDGYLQLVNINGYPIGKLEAQVKCLSSVKKRISYTFNDSKFLDYCRQGTELSILFIGVDRKNKKAYWREITPQYVNELKGKTIYLPKRNIIEESNKDYYKFWKKICELRQKVIQEFDFRRKKKDTIDEKIKASAKRKKTSSRVINKAKQTLHNLFIDQNLKYKYYYPFIDLLEPFYLDKRGTEKKQKLRKLFSITKKEEDDFIKRLVKDGLIEIVGDLCIIKDRDKAKELQNEMIDRDAIDLELITKIFL